MVSSSTQLSHIFNQKISSDEGLFIPRGALFSTYKYLQIILYDVSLLSKLYLTIKRFVDVDTNKFFLKFANLEKLLDEICDTCKQVENHLFNILTSFTIHIFTMNVYGIL